MNEHITAILSTLHSRLTLLENQVNLTGREITEPTLEESLSWDTLWDHVAEWGRKTDFNIQNHVENNEELTKIGIRTALWILAHPRPYPETMRWAEREQSEMPSSPTISLSVFDLIFALQADGLSNGG